MRMFKHLLPTGRAWSLTENKNLRRLFIALDSMRGRAQDHINNAWLDLFPETTRHLDDWEAQFGLPRVTLTDKQRRGRLAAAWKDVGGQSPGYLQNILRANGFNVTLFDWWDPETLEARNPLTVLASGYLVSVPGVDCGDTRSACGEDFAQCGNFEFTKGYPLVNKFIYDRDSIGYTVPNDPAKWPYFMYIGGENFGDLAVIPTARRYEFEALLLKIRPAHAWIGLIVRYE